MSEGLLRRWSRRKLAAGPEAAVEPAAAPAVPDVPAPELPPIDSLGIASDYTAFLGKSVPAELQKLALTRAWQSDTKIAAFRGMADYDWDFNAPGYGKLWAVDDIAKLVSAVLDIPAEEPVAESPAPPIASAEPHALPAEPIPTELVPVTTEPATESQVADATPDPVAQAPRRHGSALPC